MNLQSALSASAFMILVTTGMGAPEPAHSTTTPIIRLDGQEWLIATDNENQGREGKWFSAPRPEAKPASVPGALQEAFPNYHGLVWYWKTFEAPHNPDPRGRYLLRFESVDYKADVWVNGKEVGSHEDAEEPFTLDVTTAVHSGTGNLLAVRVLNPFDKPIDGILLKETARGAKDFPSHPGLEWNFGGILESVELLAAPAVRIEDMQVVPNWQTGEIEVNVAVCNAGTQTAKVRLGLNVAPSNGGAGADEAALEGMAPAGVSVLKGRLHVAQHRLWDLDDPFLYRVTARLETTGSTAADEQSVRCGFRNFDFSNGYFRLNGHRIFLRSAHSVWTTPIKLHTSHDLQMLRRDIIYAKTMGFNMIRFLPFAASPAQLDLCDELGVLVQQQSASSWLLGNSPQMPAQFDRSLLGVVRRDRNHPSIALWSFLNETPDGPVFRHAVDALAKVRDLDDSRVCMLNSGRFDKDPSIGSLSRPGSKTWDVSQLGDIHTYPQTPHRPGEIGELRTAGSEHKPALLAEYGIASAMDLVSLTRYYERLGATDKMDAQYYRGLLDNFMVGWKQWQLSGIFGRPEDFFKAALSANAAQRRLGMNAIRSNPNLVGYSMTALHDEVSCGEGPITFQRELKPGAVDVIRTGFAPLKWNLFVEPWNIYRGGTVHAEVVLANEDVLRPGDYSVEVVLFDPNQTPVLRETVPLHIPDLKTEMPLALPVWKQDVKIDGPAGAYRLTARFVAGASAVDDEAQFQVMDAKQMPPVASEILLCGKDAELEVWLKKNSINCRAFLPDQVAPHATVLVSGTADPGSLQQLSASIAKGAAVVFLTPFRPLATTETPPATAPQPWNTPVAQFQWLPLKEKGTMARLDVCGGFYHRDDWVRWHPIFDGLPSGGLMDWAFYRNIVPHGGVCLKTIDLPDEAVCGAVQTSYGYNDGLYLGVYRIGSGTVILNCLNIRENLGKDPVAERLLRNLLNYAGAPALKEQ